MQLVVTLGDIVLITLICVAGVAVIICEIFLAIKERKRKKKKKQEDEATQ